MNTDNNSTNFRVRTISRKLSNGSSLVRCKSQKSKKLYSTNRIHNRFKQLSCFKPPTFQSPFVQNKKKQLKRIIPKKLMSSPRIINKDLTDKDTKLLQKQSLCSLKYQNQPTYNQLIKSSNQYQFSDKLNNCLGYWPLQGKISLQNTQIEQSVNLMNHKAIVQYYGKQKINNSLYFYSEYLACGNLHEYIEQSKQPFEEAFIRNITKQLVQVVQYIHSQGRFHGNIKSSKILVGQNGEIKLSLVSSMAQQIITPNSNIRKILWSSPQRIFHNKIDKKGDIWSIGVTVLQLATQYKPWCYKAYEYFKDTKDLMKIIKTYQTPKLSLNRSSNLVSFIQMCLKFDPQERCTIEELRESKFLTSI